MGGNDAGRQPSPPAEPPRADSLPQWCPPPDCRAAAGPAPAAPPGPPGTAFPPRPAGLRFGCSSSTDRECGRPPPSLPSRHVAAARQSSPAVPAALQAAAASPPEPGPTPPRPGRRMGPIMMGAMGFGPPGPRPAPDARAWASPRRPAARNATCPGCAGPLPLFRSLRGAESRGFRFGRGRRCSPCSTSRFGRDAREPCAPCAAAAALARAGRGGIFGGSPGPPSPSGSGSAAGADWTASSPFLSLSRPPF